MTNAFRRPRGARTASRAALGALAALTLVAAPVRPVATLGAQSLADTRITPAGASNHVKLWSQRHGLSAEEAWIVEQWGGDTLVVRLRGYAGRLSGAGSETLVLPLADLQRLESFGPLAPPNRSRVYTTLGVLAGVALVASAQGNTQFRQAQLAGGAMMAGLFFAIGAQHNDRQFGWRQVPLPAGPRAAADPTAGSAAVPDR